MLEELHSGAEIARHSEALLARADAKNRWPTPVGDIVAASKLKVSEESPFSLSALARAPQHLAKAVSMLGGGRVRAILDRKEKAVYVDPKIDNAGRRNFLELHEVGHHILPWQKQLAYADNDSTLSPVTKSLFEREANQTAAELLFQGPRFAAIAAEYETNLAAVEELKRRTGASLRATLRRYAEDHRGAACGIYLAPSPCGTDPIAYRRREFSQSAQWTRRFGSTWPRVLDSSAFPFLAVITEPAVGEDEGGLTWPDLDSEPVPLRAESIRTRFGVALLLWVPQRTILRRRRRLVVTAG